MVAGEYSLRVEDVLSVVSAGLSHHPHPLPHHGRPLLHVNIQAHRLRPGSGGAAGFAVVRPEDFSEIFSHFISSTALTLVGRPV